MFSREKVLDGVAQIAGETVGIAHALKQKIRQDVRAHVDDTAARLDLVPREDYERLEAMITALTTRIEALENQKKNS